MEEKQIWEYEADARRRETEKKLAKRKNPLDQLQTILDVAGMTPGAGMPFDLVNAAISGGRGNWGELGLNLAQAVPGMGLFAGGAKITGDLAKAIKQSEFMEHTVKMKKYVKFKKMQKAIENDELLKDPTFIANKKLEKVIDNIDEKGNMWARGGGDFLSNIGNVHEISKTERFADWYDMIPEMSEMLESGVKSLTPEQLKKAQNMTPAAKKKLEELGMQLVDLLPDVPKMKQGGQIPNSKVFSYLKNV